MCRAKVRLLFFLNFLYIDFYTHSSFCLVSMIFISQFLSSQPHNKPLTQGCRRRHLYNMEGHSFLRFFQVIRLCSHRLTFMLMTWKSSSIFSSVIARITSLVRVC